MCERIPLRVLLQLLLPLMLLLLFLLMLLLLLLLLLLVLLSFSSSFSSSFSLGAFASPPLPASGPMTARSHVSCAVLLGTFLIGLGASVMLWWLRKDQDVWQTDGHTWICNGVVAVQGQSGWWYKNDTDLGDWGDAPCSEAGT